LKIKACGEMPIPAIKMDSYKRCCLQMSYPLLKYAEKSQKEGIINCVVETLSNIYNN
jgi:hypothetical protein